MDGISSAYRQELIAHEVQHAMIDWLLCNENNIRRWEEKAATMTGEIVRKIWRKL